MTECATTDLTHEMPREHNSSALSEVEHASPPPDVVVSQLPPGWLPHDVVLRAFARRNADYGWETIIPAFSIAGMGMTLDDAVENAIELLDDYLVLCANEGRSFEASYRPLAMPETAKLLARFAVGRVVGALGQGQSGRKRLDLPLHRTLTAH